jgi:hypothetical protein
MEVGLNQARNDNTAIGMNYFVHSVKDAAPWTDSPNAIPDNENVMFILNVTIGIHGDNRCAMNQNSFIVPCISFSFPHECTLFSSGR